MHAFLLYTQHTQFHYRYVQKQWKRVQEHFKTNIMHVRLVENYSNETTNMQHPKVQHSTLLQPYFTLSTIICLHTLEGSTEYQSLHVECSLAITGSSIMVLPVKHDC